MENKNYSLGIDVGSTTVKVAILDEDKNIMFSDYARHFANIQATLAGLLDKAKNKLGSINLIPSITGSGGLTLAKHLGMGFVQEVIAVASSLQFYAPNTDVAIELGGEDAKIIYFKGGIDQRMNGICAGGTGSFIDQMAALLQTDASGLNNFAKDYKAIYPIAARCGVFAKSDIQPLINEGATKEDLAASIFQAVVNQTISGLACGKPIRGRVAFLGGPLHFLSELKNAFIRTLNLTDDYIVAPDNSHLFAAIGAALNSKVEKIIKPKENQAVSLDSLIKSSDEFLEKQKSILKDESMADIFEVKSKFSNEVGFKKSKQFLDVEEDILADKTISKEIIEDADFLGSVTSAIKGHSGCSGCSSCSLSGACPASIPRTVKVEEKKDYTDSEQGGTEFISISSLINQLNNGVVMAHEVARIAPLFESKQDYEEFSKRHSKASVKTASFEDYEGNLYLGIDAGSTTTKIALIDDKGSLLWKFYSGNNGSPLATAMKALEEIKEKINPKAKIAYSCSTGYGEALLKSAFMLDEGEVETIAHYYAASFFDPEVDCILDIGGQDMKCIRIKENTVDSVQLNEACSAGCGSFIETFAHSLNYNIIDFAKEALFAENPVDLGTRCTVFMNSNVKQAQKEGATVADISSGLAYSVIKNALYKVIKITDAKSLGNHVVVQGGTFYNDAVLRAFEKISGCQAVRPDIAGIMGAFGAALIARERHENQKTTMLPLEQAVKLTYDTQMSRCKFCNNHCVLTINKFNEDRKFISGNRCERGLGIERPKNTIPNLFDYKYKRIFGYTPLKKEEAIRGEIGIPRVLNMYENYPFWATFFKKLKFKTVLSPMSTKKLYELGIESIPSESECYPAKMVHGHVTWLIRHNIKTIFYPCIPYERNERPDAGNHYNCPIVTSYAENIKNNVEDIREYGVRFLNPFMAFTNEEILTKQLVKIMKADFDIPAKEVKEAAHEAWAELIKAKEDIEKKGEETIAWLKANNKHGIVLAGRPYHVDPEIHHGIPDMIASFGLAVLTEDSVSHLAPIERPVIVSDQWMYHSRLYAAASYVKQVDFLDLIQLNSFGCGLDAVTCDQVADILNGSGKIYTTLKIDEVNNLGAARIRVRSLIAALRVRDKKQYHRHIKSAAYNREVFTKEMRSEYTILCPQMSPIHFDLLAPALNAFGYNIEVLQNDTRSTIDVGLKYVNNDACYPSLIVIGQVMEALLSGKYDLNKTAVFMSQTGGGCRASNYIGFLRRALAKADMPQVPVISVNANGMETNPGFKLTLPMLTRAMQAIVYGDLFMRVLYATRPYEAIPNSANELHKKWRAKCIESLSKKKQPLGEFKKNLRAIVKDFDELPRNNVIKPKVGVVGEILVKFSPLANNHIVELLEREGAEAVMPDLLDFLLYSFYNVNFKADNLGSAKTTAFISNVVINLLEGMRKDAREALEKSKNFIAPSKIHHLANMAKDFVSLGNQTGEGWFLTGEMLELIETGTPNIVCAQPFGCLPNHVVGKGVIKELRRVHPEANIIAVDYDPSASEVNQLNRIKLMLATAQKNLLEKSTA